jgi:biopolymer transport protein ExbB
MILLEKIVNAAADTAKAAAGAGAKPGEVEVPIIQLLFKGGWIMVPILLLLVMSIYIFFERLFTVMRASRVDRNFMNQIQDLVQHANIDGARSLCKNTNTPVARMLDKGLKKIGKPIDEIERALESAGKIEVYKLEKNLSVLGTISGIAPMFGFLGTIAGVIKIFYNISIAGDISIGVISEGLYQKMITSASGLLVGMVAHAAYHYLLLKIDREIFKMESTAVDFVDLLQEPI